MSLGTEKTIDAEQRTRVMAESIAKCSELKVHESPAWREINMGQGEGRTMDSLCDETLQLVATIQLRSNIRAANRLRVLPQGS